MEYKTGFDVRLLLRAANCATESDVPGLADLVAAHQNFFHPDLVLRILLTYLPESCEPSQYVDFLQSLASGNLKGPEAATGVEPQPAESENSLSDVRALPLLTLPHIDGYADLETDQLTRFLIAKAQRIDLETGSLTSIQQLISPFVERSEYLRIWASSTLLPLLRLDLEYYPEATQQFTLKTFEELRGRAGLYNLLFELLRRNKNAATREYARDFRGVLGPWIDGEVWRGIQKSTSTARDPSDAPRTEAEERTLIWEHVFEALLDHTVENPANITGLAESWNGPDDVDRGDWGGGISADKLHTASGSYAQMMLAAIYLPTETGPGFSHEQQLLLLRKAASLVRADLRYDPFKADLTASASLIPYEFLTSLSTIHLARGELMDSENPLTSHSGDSVQLAALFMASTSILEGLGESMPLPALASLSLFGHSSDQKKRAQKILRALTARSSAGDGFWRDMRQKMLWLRAWNVQNSEEAPRHGVFCRVSREDLEVDILKTLISAGRFKLLSDVYVSSEESLPRSVVEKSLIEVALAAFDGSETGNKTRGEMKQASDIISTFRFQFPESVKLQELYYLIQATHALSFYNISLNHGRAYSPGQLRAARNPVGVIDRLLTQNSKSYTKLDDLIDIGHNLVKAGLVRSKDEASEPINLKGSEASDRTERHIIAMAVEAALAEDDFDTAYSYIVNRLSFSRSETRSETDEREQSDDPLWRAAYLAGRYRSKKPSTSSELRRIEQRMELLSQAAQLAPPISLQEILQTWRECEGELNAWLSKETEEEEQWNYKGDRTIPGGFSLGDVAPVTQRPRETTRGALSEEGPMGLFDVARGAATAFSKSAFPLVGHSARAAASLTSSHTSASHDETGGSNQQNRVRKRDMVSSAVTGGIASGIGWVIGANPVREE